MKIRAHARWHCTHWYWYRSCSSRMVAAASVIRRYMTRYNRAPIDIYCPVPVLVTSSGLRRHRSLSAVTIVHPLYLGLSNPGMSASGSLGHCYNRDGCAEWERTVRRMAGADGHRGYVGGCVVIEQRASNDIDCGFTCSVHIRAAATTRQRREVIGRGIIVANCGPRGLRRTRSTRCSRLPPWHRKVRYAADQRTDEWSCHHRRRNRMQRREKIMVDRLPQHSTPHHTTLHRVHSV